MENNETTQEYTVGNTVSFKMNLTPEQYQVIKEWSLSIPTLYMLDICTVNVTKLTDTSLESNSHKARVASFLREIDRPANGISYFFSLMEKVSDSRGIDTNEELEKKILSDISALKKFFKKARVVEPDDFILAYLNELRRVPVEIKRSDYLSFLRALNNEFELYDTVASKDRFSIAVRMIEAAKALDIVRQHPVVVIGLACLYGNRAAKKLMKFKSISERFDPENALADIMMISRFAQFKLEIEHKGRSQSGYMRAEFLTDDNGLIQILECFSPTVVKHVDKDEGRETQLTMNVSLEKILTEISDEEYDEILSLLS